MKKSRKELLKYEKWLPVYNYEFAYEVSDLGRVRSVSRDEEIKEALINETEKRGFKEGVKIKNHQGIFILEKLDLTFKDQYNVGIYTKQECVIWLMVNGVWAEIIPNTITRAEAEKQLNSKIID